MRTVIVFFLLSGILFSQTAKPIRKKDTIRVATYNIQNLNENVPDARLSSIRKVLTVLDADIIGLQEIKDRRSLEKVFRKESWHLIIDDDSRDYQDVALAVTKSLNVLDFRDGRCDADDEHFLFSHESNDFFPKRRDVLSVRIAIPGMDTLTLMVLHAKARSEGRAKTEWRRTGAATRLLQKLKQGFSKSKYIILGDFNDSPDDWSLNILETGNPRSGPKMETKEGPFLINLMESLYARGFVNTGRTLRNLLADSGLINTLDPGARLRNYQHRKDNRHVGDSLYDQILIPMHMKNHYVPGSARVFDDASGVLPDLKSRASDHLPVFADFLFQAPDRN